MVPLHLTAYTLGAYALALGDITPFSRNFVYAGSVIRHGAFRR